MCGTCAVASASARRAATSGWSVGGSTEWLDFRSCRVGRGICRRAALQRRSKPCFRCVRSIRPGGRQIARRLKDLGHEAVPAPSTVTAIFKRHGLELGALCGGPSAFTRPDHSQTMGKDDRFHRSLKAEVLSGPPFANLAAAERAFDRWRNVYNRASEHPSVYVVEEKRLC